MSNTNFKLTTEWMQHLQSSILSIALLLIVLAASAQQKEPFMTKSLAGAGIKAVEVSTSGGSISVQHVAGEQPRVEVYIQGNNNKSLSKEEIQQRLNDDYELSVTVAGGKVNAYAKRRKNGSDWNNGLSISFRLFTDEKVDSKLTTSGGSISLKQLNGKHEFTTSGGSIHVDGMKGNLDGSTSGGSISLTNSNATADLTTSGGSIEANNNKGKLSLTTSGGSLHFTKLQGSINASTSGGSVNAEDVGGEMKVATSGGSMHLNNMHCSLDAATSGGSMNVHMAALGSYLKLRNSAGNISVSLPAGKGMDIDFDGDRISVPNLTNFSGEASNTKVKGKLNGGGVPVSVKSSGGKVTVLFGNVQ